MNSSRSSNSNRVHHHHAYYHMGTGNQFPNCSLVGSYNFSHYSNRHEGESSMNGYQNYDMNYQTNSSNGDMGHNNVVPRTPYNCLNHPEPLSFPEYQQSSNNIHTNPMHSSEMQQQTYGHYSDQGIRIDTHQPFYPVNHDNGY